MDRSRPWPALLLCLPVALLVGCGGVPGNPTSVTAAGSPVPGTAGVATTAAGRTSAIPAPTRRPAGGTSPSAKAVTGAGNAASRPFKGVANSACADLTRLKVSWYYNWTLSPGSCRAPGFVPMISGKNEKSPAAVSSALRQVASAGYRTVLGFNEPNKASQADLTLGEVLALWPKLTANAAVRVGSPATSADAKAWFTEFMAQVTAKKLRVDFIALHWYGWNAGSCDVKAAELERYIAWAEAIPGNRPLWITEWGCMNQSNPDAATVQAFYRGALAVFARHPRIERYAWYPWNTHNELVNGAGALTALGSAVARASATR